MTIDSILSKIPSEKNVIHLSEKADASISVINKEPFYIEPVFFDDSSNNSSNARIMLFSASGAVGKSILAQYISFKYKTICWDLSKICLGDNSFMGTMYKSIDTKSFTSFIDGLKNGKTLIVIDAFDEAMISSGKKNVNSLLKDIADYSEGSTMVSFILLARTEAAREILLTYKNMNVDCVHFEIGYISETNAQRFIVEGYLKNNPNKVNNKIMIERCIEAQFSTIKSILKSNSKEFIGYAPVLQALISAIEENGNTYSLIAELKEGNAGTITINNILNELLRREREEKFLFALKKRWAELYPDFDDWEKLYSDEEQMVRVLEYTIFGESGAFYSLDCLTKDMKEDYEKEVDDFIKMHPFITKKLNEEIEFVGPAFRDFTISKLISCSDYSEVVDEYCSKSSSAYVPSELLLDLYCAKGKLSAKFFGLMYISAKAKERNSSRIITTVISDDESTEAIFKLWDSSNNNGSFEKSIEICDRERIIIGNLYDANITYNGDIIIDNGSKSIEIVNSSLECNSLIIPHDIEVVFHSRNNSICSLDINNKIITEGNPSFKCFTDREENVIFNAENIRDFHSLAKYYKESNNSKEREIIDFSRCVDKILDCMRKHKKDAPAKDKEYIDNEIIANNEYKKNILCFLIEKGIVYSDRKDSHEYKLDVDKLGQYKIGWQALQQFGVNRFIDIYEDFLSYMKQDNE